MIAAVIFDLDGVLIHSEDLWMITSLDELTHELIEGVGAHSAER